MLEQFYERIIESYEYVGNYLILLIHDAYDVPGTCRVAILYALGYLYEHRDEADHKQLMLTLRSILFAVREGVF